MKRFFLENQERGQGGIFLEKILPSREKTAVPTYVLGKSGTVKANSITVIALCNHTCCMHAYACWSVQKAPCPLDPLSAVNKAIH